MKGRGTMIKKECGSCQFYKVSCSISDGTTLIYGYGECVKGKEKEVKKTATCPFYLFDVEAAERYKPSFLYEESFIHQLVTLKEETMKKYLSDIQNQLCFRVNEEGERIYRYNLQLLIKRLRKSHPLSHYQRAEWFIKQQTQQYEKELERLAKKREKFNLLR